MQKTNFDFVHIIGEDASTDNTRNIIESYSKKYPDKIKLINHKINVGAHENTKILFKEVNAKYIALLDGDDYWSDPYKLQKQVDFLNANPDYALCFHNYKIKNEGNKNEDKIYYKERLKDTLEISDIAKRNLIPTHSCVVRTEAILPLPDWFHNISAGDWALWLIALRNKTKGKYIHEAMSVYRVNGSSIWASKGWKYVYHQSLNNIKLMSQYMPEQKHNFRVKKLNLYYDNLNYFSSNVNILYFLKYFILSAFFCSQTDYYSIKDLINQIKRLVSKTLSF